MTGQGILAAGITIGGFKWTGNFTTIDLIAATTNALNGALLARRPDHYRNFTIVGVLLMALLGGIGGGVTRDVILNKIPAAFTNPAYILLCLAAGIVGYLIAFGQGQMFAGNPDTVAKQITQFRRRVGGIKHIIMMTRQGLVTHAEAEAS